jgi:hypothetical protein
MGIPTNVAPELRLLGDEPLAELRALNEANLPHTCAVTAEQQTGGRVGGALATASTPTTVLPAGTPCRLIAYRSRRGATEILQADQPFLEDQWFLSFRIGVVVPEGALATVSGVDGLGNPWTRLVRVGTPVHSRAYEIESRYAARDVNVAGR